MAWLGSVLVRCTETGLKLFGIVSLHMFAYGRSKRIVKYDLVVLQFITCKDFLLRIKEEVE